MKRNSSATLVAAAALVLSGQGIAYAQQLPDDAQIRSQQNAIQGTLNKNLSTPTPMERARTGSTAPSALDARGPRPDYKPLIEQVNVPKRPEGRDMPEAEQIDKQRRSINKTIGELPAPAKATGNVAATPTPQIPLASPIAGQPRTLADFQRITGQRKTEPVPQTATPESTTTDLLIFVSMSMPDAMLKSYAAQAKRFNAVMVIRGFHEGKMTSTQRKIKSLNDAGVPWEINPEPFKLFKIEKVPAVVLATSRSGESLTEDGCAQPDTYTVIHGDLSVFDALDKIAVRAQPEIAQKAKQKLAADREAARKG